MESAAEKHPTRELELQKSKTGIQGLDEVLNGGLPTGRPTLVCGGAGCGKTLLASEFLVRGALEYNEPGVFFLFEETRAELASNLRSLGVDLEDLEAQGKIFVDYIRIDRSEIEETGEYDLEGLFIRLADAVNRIGAKRVVLDTIETIFASFSNQAVLRSELRRLFRWLKDHGLTAVITGERGEGTLTRHGLEEYVSDCVILLEHRVRDHIATRFLRVVKYRGSSHGSDEYPFLIDQDGIWVLPITSSGLNYPVSREFISTGVPRLDTMLNGQGYYRGSSVLVSGAPGSGKTSLAAYLANAACQRGERCLYLAYEESAEQIMRNMASIGLDLAQWVRQGLLHFRGVRRSLYGTEMHLLSIHKLVAEYRPQVVVIDPVSNMTQVASSPEVLSMLVRLIDYLKTHSITALYTAVSDANPVDQSSKSEISSLMDTWLMLCNLESNGERNRLLYVLKSRGMPHSNQVREFRLTSQGIELVDVYSGLGGMLVGSARLSQEAAERAEQALRQQNLDRLQYQRERKQQLYAAQQTALQAAFEAEVNEIERAIQTELARQRTVQSDRQRMSEARQADLDANNPAE